MRISRSDTSFRPIAFWFMRAKRPGTALRQFVGVAISQDEPFSHLNDCVELRSPIQPAARIAGTVGYTAQRAVVLALPWRVPANGFWHSLAKIVAGSL